MFTNFNRHATKYNVSLCVWESHQTTCSKDWTQANTDNSKVDYLSICLLINGNEIHLLEHFDMRFLSLLFWSCRKAPYCAHMSPVWSTLVHAERRPCGGPLIHSGVMELSLREAANERPRTKDAGRAGDRGCNLSSFVLFYARIFRRPLLGRRALAHAPAHAPTNRVRPDGQCPSGWAPSNRLGPNGQYVGSDRCDRRRLPHCPFLPSSVSPSFYRTVRDIVCKAWNVPRFSTQ